MSTLLKREVVYLITGVVAVTMFIDFFFFPKGWDVASTLQTWAMIIGNIALGLGAVRLLLFYGKQVQKRTVGVWHYSVWLIVYFFICLITGLAGYITLGHQDKNPIYYWNFTNVYTPLGQALYAMTGFYIFSAAYRAFRARNIDAALLLIAGCFTLLTNAPIGEVIWVQIPVIGRWFLDIGQVPGMRTFMIAGAFGLLAYGFRALLGKEKGFYAEVGGQ